jgi:hypothetical protein
MTTVMNRTQPTAAHDGADDCNNLISRIQVLSKKGEHS